MRTNIDETGAVSIVCAGPETWKANTDVGTVELRRWWRCEADAITGTSVAPQCWVYVRPSQRQSIGQLQADVVRPIQNLLTFLTDRPNGICDLSFSDRSAPALAADEPLGYTLIYAPTPVVAPPDNILLPDDVLVHAKDIDDFQQMIRKWFRFAADYPSFIARLFTLIEQPSPFVERRFLESVHLAGLYYLGTARNGRRDQLCAAIRGALDASGLEGVAVGAVEAAAIKVGAWKWLTVLMQDAREVTVAVVGPHADQFLGRVQQITATLELGCERGGCVDNAELYWTNEKLLGLLKTAVLGELGFERSAQLGLLRRNRRIRFTAAK